MSDINKVEREVIKLSEFEIAPILCDYASEDEDYEEYYDENGDIIGNPIWNQFVEVERELINYNLEKSYEVFEVTVQRKSDSKFFKSSYTESYYRENNYGTTLIEVFPKTITKVIYE